MKILIVEDNRASLKLVVEVLKMARHDVIGAESAEEAMSLLEKSAVDLVLTDIMLPGMDGLSLTRKLRMSSAMQNIPVVAMTANLVCDENLALDAGCDALLSKPLNTRTLAERLTAILRCAVEIHHTPSKPVLAGHPDPDALPLQVLIIEDDPTSLKLTGTLLMMSGYLVSVAASAEQAALAIKANRPDVIVMDLNLPRLNGLEFVQALRAEAATKEIPVLAFTAFPQSFDRSASLQAGCDAYLLKPVDTRQLPAQLAAMLKASGKTGHHQAGGDDPTNHADEITYR